jgi:hypothetical protein
MSESCCDALGFRCSAVDGLPSDPVYQRWETLSSSQDLRLYSRPLALIGRFVLIDIRADGAGTGSSIWGLTNVCSKALPLILSLICSVLCMLEATAACVQHCQRFHLSAAIALSLLLGLSNDSTIEPATARQTTEAHASIRYHDDCLPPYLLRRRQIPCSE